MTVSDSDMVAVLKSINDKTFDKHRLNSDNALSKTFESCYNNGYISGFNGSYNCNDVFVGQFVGELEVTEYGNNFLKFHS